MTVVSNTSPIINLAYIGHLDLLRDLYGSLLIPQAVWTEIVNHGAGQPGAQELASADWIQATTVTNRQLVTALRQDLDSGEAEAIVLALETEAELLLMDERLRRETARHLEVNRVGLIGVLVKAKQEGLIGAVRPYLDELRFQAGFWITDALYARVLEDAGE